MHFPILIAVGLVAVTSVSGQTPTVNWAGESMRLRSATVTGTAPSFSVRAVMDDDNGNPSLPTSWRRWWHFEVAGVPAGAGGSTFQFEIRNAGYSDVILPVWSRSTNGGSTFGDYERCPLGAVPSVSSSTHRFTLTVPSGTTHFRIAKYFPFTVTRKNAMLARIAGRPGVRRIVSLGGSTQGRSIDLVELTDRGVPDTGKVRIWIHAGVHPAETPAHFMAEGLIEWLSSGHVLAETLLDRAIVDVVPMANPDGVALGNYRTNARSVNLEEQWTAPYTSTVPEIVALRTAIEQRMGSPTRPAANPIRFLLNLHATHNVRFPFHFRHVSNPNFDLVTNRSGVIPAVHALEQLWIDALRAESPSFVARGTTQNSTLGAPRRPFVESMMHDRWTIDPAWTGEPVMAITLEGTYADGDGFRAWSTADDYLALGEDIGRALAQRLGIRPGGSVITYGVRCSGAAFDGAFISTASRFAMIATSLPANANGAMAFGLDRISAPLPGPSACPLLTTPIVTTPVFSGPFGLWQTSLTVPAALASFQANTQVLLLDLPNLDWIGTNGAQLTFSR